MKSTVQFMLFAAVAAHPYYEQASSYSADYTNCVVNVNGQAYTVGTDQGCTPTSSDVYSTEAPDVYPTSSYEVVTSYPVSSSEYPVSTAEETYPVTSDTYPTESPVYTASASEYPVVPPPASYDTSSNAAYPTTPASNGTSYLATATASNSYSPVLTSTTVQSYPTTTKAATSASAVATAGASTHGSGSMFLLVGVAAAVFAL